MAEASEAVPAVPPEGAFPSSDWLLAEYELLSEHYFHEDKLFMNVTSIFSTLNGLLLAVVVGKDSNAAHGLQLALPAFGVVLCLTWWASLYRIRRWRRNVEQRIHLLELSVRPLLWPPVEDALSLRPDGAAKMPLLTPATRAPVRWLDGLPTTRLLLGLPIAIGIIWLVVAYFLIAN